MRCTEKTGKLVKIMEVVDSDDLIVITDAGVLMRQPIAAIRTIGRVTQGVRLVKLDGGSLISSITRVMEEAEKKEAVEIKNEDEKSEEQNTIEN
jgi:DNA gyrase subunit A